MQLQQLAAKAGLELRGPADVEVTGVASFSNATATDVVFVEDAKFAAAAEACAAGAVIAAPMLADSLGAKALLVTDNPRLAFARVAEILRQSEPVTASVHPTAVVDASAQIGANVAIAAHAFVGPRVTIGDNSVIGPGSVLLSDIALGADCRLVSRVTIYPNTRIGSRALLHAGCVLGADGFGFVRDPATGVYEKFPQIGSLEIGDDVEIGANTTIDRGALGPTRIGNGVKLDNLVHLAHNVSVGDNVVIAAQTGVSGSSVIEHDAIVAGQVGIADHVRIEEGAILGAQCGVPTKKVIRGKGVLFWGTPARPINEYLRELAALSRLAKKKTRE